MFFISSTLNDGIFDDRPSNSYISDTNEKSKSHFMGSQGCCPFHARVKRVLPRNVPPRRHTVENTRWKRQYSSRSHFTVFDCILPHHLYDLKLLSFHISLKCTTQKRVIHTYLQEFDSLFTFSDVTFSKRSKMEVLFTKIDPQA